MTTPTIRTVVGTGETGHTGDDGPASEATLSDPNGIPEMALAAGDPKC